MDSSRSPLDHGEVIVALVTGGSTCLLVPGYTVILPGTVYLMLMSSYPVLVVTGSSWDGRGGVQDP